MIYLPSKRWRVLIGTPLGAAFMLVACSSADDGSRAPQLDISADAGSAEAAFDGDAGTDAADADELESPPPYDFEVQCTATPCVTRITARGGEHACVILKDGAVRCWGSNASGQLGTGKSDAGSLPSFALSPREVAGITGATSVAATGSGHSGTTCVVSGTGDVSCFGSNASGQLGRDSAGSKTPEPEPVVLAGLEAKSVALTNTFALAVAGDDSLWSWGTNDAQQLARSTSDSDPDAASASTPARAERVSGAVRTAAGNSKTAFVLLDSGALLSWGGTTTDQLARLTSLSVDPLPAPIALTDVVSVATGESHACALARGRVYCWGKSEHGQLGTARKADELFPARVLMPAGIYVVALGAGANDTCAISSKGSVYCWGANAGGQLGVSPGIDQPSPIEVGGIPEEAVAVAVMDKAICTLLRGGAVWCRGDNLLGQLGRGVRDVEPQLAPGPVVFK